VYAKKKKHHQLFSKSFPAPITSIPNLVIPVKWIVVKDNIHGIIKTPSGINQKV